MKNIQTLNNWKKTKLPKYGWVEDSLCADTGDAVKQPKILLKRSIEILQN